MEVFLFLGVVTSLPVRLTSPGVRKMRALMRAVTVTITSEVGICRACVVSLQAAITSGIRGSIGGMIIRRVRLINTFCGEFPLVVSVYVIFIFYPSLV